MRRHFPAFERSIWGLKLCLQVTVNHYFSASYSSSAISSPHTFMLGLVLETSLFIQAATLNYFYCIFTDTRKVCSEFWLTNCTATCYLDQSSVFISASWTTSWILTRPAGAFHHHVIHLRSCKVRPLVPYVPPEPFVKTLKPPINYTQNLNFKVWTEELSIKVSKVFLV